MMGNFVVNVIFFSVEIDVDRVKKPKINKLNFHILFFLVSREGSQVIMAAIFVFIACITPILFRSIYRILKRKLNRSSTIYGELHCLDNRLEKKKKIFKY